MYPSFLSHIHSVFDPLPATGKRQEAALFFHDSKGCPTFHSLDPQYLLRLAISFRATKIKSLNNLPLLSFLSFSLPKTLIQYHNLKDMDSCNSGSMQSSSGDEEYESRSESAAAAPPPPIFLNQHQHQHPPTFFDHIPSSNNYLHALSQSQPNSNPNSLMNLDLVNKNNNNTVNLQGSSSSLATHHQGLINHGSFLDSSTMQLQQSRLLNDHQTNVNVKNPKKRTRTSRRAPTTVLTTDTSNFRAMVQEFTGIPAQPFSVGSSYSRRFDLFSSGLAIKSSSGNNLEPMGGPLSYPLRLSTQNLQPIPFVSSSIDATTSTITTTSISDTSHNTTSNFQILSNLGLNNNKEPQNILNNLVQQNLNYPVVSFQSLIQHSPNVTGTNFDANKYQASNFAVPSFEDQQHHLAMSHAHVGVPNQDHLRSFEGKLNYSANSSSDFHHHDKNLENVSSRGEGTVDSWNICPSD